MTELTPVKQRSLAKGLVAGLIGGVAGTVAMLLTERILPLHPGEVLEPGPPALDGATWGFGLAVGAAYGALAEFFPAAKAKDGASFGMTLGALTQERTVPAPDALGGITDEFSEKRTDEMTTHVVYGITTEFVRRFVRERL